MVCALTRDFAHRMPCSCSTTLHQQMSYELVTLHALENLGTRWERRINEDDKVIFPGRAPIHIQTSYLEFTVSSKALTRKRR